MEMVTHLKSLVNKVEVKALESGDYAFGEIAIERKELGDLLNSLHDGRYFRQLKVLADTYGKPLILFEGDIDNTTLVRFMKVGRKRMKRGFVLNDSEKKTIRETQHGTLFGWRVPILQSSSVEDSAVRIAEIYNREMGYKVTSAPGPAVKKSVDVKEIRYNMVCCVNGIGGTLGKRILKVTPTFSDMRDMGAEVLCKRVDKLPLERAKMLVEAIQ